MMLERKRSSERVSEDPAAAQEVRDEVGIRPWPVVIGIQSGGVPTPARSARRGRARARSPSSTTVGRRLVTG